MPTERADKDPSPSDGSGKRNGGNGGDTSERSPGGSGIKAKLAARFRRRPDDSEKKVRKRGVQTVVWKIQIAISHGQNCSGVTLVFVGVTLVFVGTHYFVSIVCCLVSTAGLPRMNILFWLLVQHVMNTLSPKKLENWHQSVYGPLGCDFVPGVCHCVCAHVTSDCESLCIEVELLFIANGYILHLPLWLNGIVCVCEHCSLMNHLQGEHCQFHSHTMLEKIPL